MKKINLILFISLSFLSLNAQITGKKIDVITGTFNSTRVINTHSTEMLNKGEMDFRILHRFGLLNSGVQELFGLDNATMRLSFDFGISKNLMLGIGRSTLNKDVDVFAKTKLLHQSVGDKNCPISLLVVAGYIVSTQKYVTTPSLTDRSSYTLQLLIGRKFSENFSAQLSPILVHNNTILTPNDDQNIIGLGGGVRCKVSKRIALLLDYHYAIGKQDASITNPLSIGVDIKTGRHVFTLHFSNSSGLNEKGYLTQTTGQFGKGDIRFGFNLSRIFNIQKK